MRATSVVAFAAIIVLFVIAALALAVLAAIELFHGVDFRSPKTVAERVDAVIEAVTLLTIAVASLELGQTIFEEEVLRTAQMSAPTRVRRFLSRFMVVIVVALSTECLGTIFRFVHEDPKLLPQAASIGVAAALLLVGWGVFLRLNRSVEELEPEAMEKAKDEDPKVDAD